MSIQVAERRNSMPSNWNNEFHEYSRVVGSKSKSIDTYLNLSTIALLVLSSDSINLSSYVTWNMGFAPCDPWLPTSRMCMCVLCAQIGNDGGAHHCTWKNFRLWDFFRHLHCIAVGSDVYDTLPITFNRRQGRVVCAIPPRRNGPINLYIMHILSINYHKVTFNWNPKHRLIRN